MFLDEIWHDVVHVCAPLYICAHSVNCWTCYLQFLHLAPLLLFFPYVLTYCITFHILKVSCDHIHLLEVDYHCLQLLRWTCSSWILCSISPTFVYFVSAILSMRVFLSSQFRTQSSDGTECVDTIHFGFLEQIMLASQPRYSVLWISCLIQCSFGECYLVST